MRVARSATTGIEVVLEIGVSSGDFRDGCNRGGGEWRPAEVRVKHDAGCIENWTERRQCGAFHPLGDCSQQNVLLDRFPLVPELRQGCPNGFNDECAGMLFEQRAQLRALDENSDAR